jgi:hypothetical protein
MEICGWPQKHVQSFAHFYFNLELDPMRARPNGERVLIIYHAKVRRQWHDDLSRGQGFNIAPINQKLLSAVAEEVWDTIKTEAIKKVSTPPEPSLTHAKNSYFALSFTIHSHTTFVIKPTPSPCHAILPRTHMCYTKSLPKHGQHSAMSSTDDWPYHPHIKLPCHFTNTANHAMPPTKHAIHTQPPCHAIYMFESCSRPPYT